MSMFLRQSTASQEILIGPFVDSTDGNTAETALTIANTDIKLWFEGGTTLSSKNSGGATHISNGYYYTVLDATDTATVGKMEVNVKVSGALAVRREFHVLEEAVYDAWFAASGTGVPSALSTLIATAQTDLDTITGSDGVTLASSQPNVEAYSGSQLETDIAALDTKLGTPNTTIADDIENVSGGDGASLLVSTTIATLTNQYVFTITSGPPDNDVLNGHNAVIIDADSSSRKDCIPIKDYVGSTTRKVTLSRAPKFTIAVGDTFKAIIDSKPLLTAEFVDRNHTFRFDNSRQTTAPNRITENTSFDGLIKMDFSNVLDSDDSLATINSVSISPTSGDEPTLGTSYLYTDGTSVIIPVACTEDGDPCDTGTYTITVSVTSADAQTYSRTGKFIVESA